MHEDSEQEERRIQPFSAFLIEHRGGELHAEITDALRQLTAAVQGVGKGGSLTLSLSVKPAGTSDNQVFVIDEVRLKLPEPDRAPKLLFVDHDGNLTRRDPDQPELPGLRTVPERRPRTIDRETGEVVG